MNPKSSCSSTTMGLAILFSLLLLGSLPGPAQCGRLVSNDTIALLRFRAMADPKGVLHSWNFSSSSSPPSPSPSPFSDGCEWVGVACQKGRVIRLELVGLGLDGTMDALGALNELHLLNLANNALAATASSIFFAGLPNLRQLNLSGNRLTGPLPETLFRVHRLRCLDLSGNGLNGSIPTSLNRLTHLAILRLGWNSLSGGIPSITISSLTELRLEGNLLSGSLPALNLPNLTALNVSGNRLSGKIPSTLFAFPPSSFSSNPHLCSALSLLACGATFESPPIPPPTSIPSVLSSGPRMPLNTKHSVARLSTQEIIAVATGVVAVLLSVSALAILLYHRRRRSSPPHLQEKPIDKNDGNRDVLSNHYAYQVPDERGDLIFLEGGRFELGALLGAAAEMLGKGSFGTTYKAVLEDGSLVAVKRLKDTNATGKKEFEQQMAFIGALQHPNVMRLKAYYYTKEEKLMVYDYMPNGSLFNLLHGNRGPGRVPFTWSKRLWISLGAARGLAHIHREFGAQKIPHGDIKSSNVLLEDATGNARLSDFGMSLLITHPHRRLPTLMGYTAPEHMEARKVSQRGDVYGFGVLLLEILTGKIPGLPQAGGTDLPRWARSVVQEEWTAEVFDLELMRDKDIEDDLVRMLQVALACVSQNPDERPKMEQVVKMIEDIVGKKL